ncbi:hypothetical protein [Sphingorhabdus sp. Alg231-15]|uniref:hypothetical protein n=1 Tax=Sphingorhabdus sp. Alg231-15 TaxID=1922222 RepID=UPI000D55CF1C
MHASRTTLSFLDLALMLLSAFAYAHFVNLADPETRQKLAEKSLHVPEILGNYDYDTNAFFSDSSAVLTNFARQEIAEIMLVQESQLLTISVPVANESRDDLRLRQWEKVAARSAAIADAFEKAGQDGEMIILKMPDKLISQADRKKHISLTFLPSEKDQVDKR